MSIAPVRFALARSAPARFAPVRFALIRFAPLRSAAASFAPEEERAEEVRAGEVHGIEIDRLSVVSGIPAPDDNGSRLHVGACRARGGVSTWLIGQRRPLLAGMLADGRGQDLHHRGVVSGRVTRDSLQR